MDGCVLKFVLFFVIEDNAVVIDEIEDASFPKRATEKLYEEIILPLLREGTATSSFYCYA